MPQKFKVLPGTPAIASEQSDAGGGSIPASGSLPALVALQKFCLSKCSKARNLETIAKNNGDNNAMIYQLGYQVGLMDVLARITCMASEGNVPVSDAANNPKD